MARRWTTDEENKYRAELIRLYVRENRSLKEVAKVLKIAEQTVFQRLNRLDIPTRPDLKTNYRNRRSDIIFPTVRSESLAEFFGIMLGDGHVSRFQILVTLGNKEESYAQHVCALMKKLFGASPSIGIRKTGYRDVYLGSVALAKWLFTEGLVSHKVAAQVRTPRWIFAKKKYMTAFLRGFFDTDGSVYKLKYGTQVSFTNMSKPLLRDLQEMLRALGYGASGISGNSVYLTKNADVRRFFREAGPANTKHRRRFAQCVGTQAVNEGRL